MRPRVAVAMSGGVDSSVAAALLVEAGDCEVFGVGLSTHRREGVGPGRCCSPADLADARQVADHLDIPFQALDASALFAAEVIAPFADAYAHGRTPNPCVACNDQVKVAPLWAWARGLGAQALATGHYARVLATPSGPALARGTDAGKDQSYFLYRTPAAMLGHLRFPIGHLHKAEVRAHARRLGLPVADKPESQELCFVGAGGYAAEVEAERARRGLSAPPAGEVVDPDGRVLGRHRGVHHFTRGQRRGLGLGSGGRLYVLEADAARGRLTVGPRAALEGDELWLNEVRWLGPAPSPERPLALQQRHRRRPDPATCWTEGARARVRLERPAPLGAPGQAAVLYDGERVVGGGTIAGERGGT